MLTGRVGCLFIYDPVEFGVWWMFLMHKFRLLPSHNKAICFIALKARVSGLTLSLLFLSSSGFLAAQEVSGEVMAPEGAAFHNSNALLDTFLPVLTRDGDRKVVLRPLNPDQAPRVVLETVQFELNSDALLPASCRQLDVVAQTLAGSFSEYRFAVEGHTCALGEAAYNKSLSWKRVRSVLRYLRESGGVNVEGFEAYGFGEERLIALQEQDAWKNRRVELVRLEPKTVAPVPSRSARFEGKAELAERAGDETRCDSRFLCEVRFKGMRDLSNGWDEFYPDAEVSVQEGGTIRSLFKIQEACHLFLLYLDAGGAVRWLAPETKDLRGLFAYLSKAGEQWQLPDARLTVAGTVGRSVLVLIAANGPLFDGMEALLASKGAGLTAADIEAAHPNPIKGGDAPLEGTGDRAFASPVPFDAEVYLRTIVHVDRSAR